eukprot:1223495-Prymnesium_polylepis.1
MGLRSLLSGWRRHGFDDSDSRYVEFIGEKAQAVKVAEVTVDERFFKIAKTKDAYKRGLYERSEALWEKKSEGLRRSKTLSVEDNS